MADKSRIAELDKAIKDTRAELAAIQREKQAAKEAAVQKPEETTAKPA